MEAQIPAVRAFCVYASEDRALFHKLEQALGVYRRQGLISLWHFGELLPGSEWDSEIQQRLYAADLILLLISPAFLHSEYIWNKELQWAMTRHTSGDACAVPILLKPTPDWKKLPLGQLQALPTGMKPITTWRNRDKALEDVVEGVGQAIQQILQKEQYTVQEYLAGLRPSIYEDQVRGGAAAQEMAKQRAEQWIKEVHDRTDGSLVEIALEENQREWILTRQQERCRITLRWDYRGMGQDSRYFRSADILLTTPDLGLLDHLISAGRQPYWLFQWTLVDDFDVAKLATQIYEQTGKGSIYLMRRGGFGSLDYHMYNGEEHAVRATFYPKFAQAPARVCLIHDGLPRAGFYHAHKMFSIRKIALALRGEIPYGQVGKLIEKACTLDAG
ncbi:MAG: toll/interleukin-1 receptor domain-containing protein [Ktedonobacteraceae bacterium]|nr:toll/interleukin-1 receptor domain-containing protein [Ktedonobacteraceae bacterium]